MKFLSITGPKADIDRVVDTYLSRYEIHLENALSELKTVKDLRPYIETNPYKEKLNLARELAEKIGGQLQSVPEKELPSQEEAAKTVDDISSRLKELNDKKEELQAQIQTLKRSKDQVEPFTELNYSVKEILGFQFIKFRFGRISREYFDKFNSYVYETIDTVMFKCLEDAEYVWIVYFVPEKLADKIDAIYASMHFERCFLPDEYEGTPMEAEHVLDDKIKALEAEKQELEGKILQTLDENKQELAAACTRLERFSVNFDVRKMAACTKHGDHTFYILCGWMSETDAKKFQKEIESDADTFCIIEDDHNNIMSTPPTKMKNPGLFKPFEMYVEMYGLPSYNEIDPTILIGITYSILFGFMFGDAGQGLCLLIGGFLLYKFKKMRLAGIISCCGFFSTIFGVLFDKVKFKSGKKCVPWLKISLVFIPLTTVMLFAIPNNFSENAKLAWLTVAYILWDTAYTLCDVPIFGIIPSMSENIAERNSIISYKQIWSGVGSGVALILGTVLVGEQVKLNYTVVAIICAVFAIITMLPACFKLEERFGGDRDEDFTLKKMFSYLVQNKYLLIYYIGYFFYSSANVSGSLNLFVSFYLFNNSQFSLVVQALSLVPAAIFSFLVPHMVRKFDKMKLFRVCTLATVILSVVMWLIGYNSMIGFIIISILRAVPMAILGVMLFMFTPDCAEFGKFTSGIEAKGVTFAIQPFMCKLTAAVSGALGMFILGLKSTGWVSVEGAQNFADLQGVTQTDHAKAVLWFIYVMFTAIGYAIAYVIWTRYKLTDKDVQTMADCNSGKITRAEAEERLGGRYDKKSKKAKK